MAVAGEERKQKVETTRRTMRAIVRDSYGPTGVLGLEEVKVPQVEDDMVLIRVEAASVNALDWHVLTGLPYLVRIEMGFPNPKGRGLGADVSGRVEAIGAGVTRFKVGDEVFGDIGNGSFAEYALAREDGLAVKPSNVSHEVAATVPVAGLTALQALRDTGGLQPGQRVLINGASGGVGHLAIPIAKILGAHVTAVCNTAHLNQARHLGADEVLDYTTHDFAATGRRFNLAIDLPGNRPWSDFKRILTRHGTYVVVGGPKGRFLGPIPRMLRFKLASSFGTRKAGWLLAQANPEDMETLAAMLESGGLRPVIEATYPLTQLPEAISRFSKGHMQAKIAIKV